MVECAVERAEPVVEWEENRTGSITCSRMETEHAVEFYCTSSSILLHILLPIPRK